MQLQVRQGSRLMLLIEAPDAYAASIVGGHSHGEPDCPHLRLDADGCKLFYRGERVAGIVVRPTSPPPLEADA